jgi:hypothetical protein
VWQLGSVWIPVQHRHNAACQRIEMSLDYRGSRLRVDFAEVVVDQDVAKTIDIAPGNVRPSRLQVFRKMLC